MDVKKVGEDFLEVYRVTNVKVLGKSRREEESVGRLRGGQEEKLVGAVHAATRGSVMVETVEVLVNGRWNRGRRRDQMINDIGYGCDIVKCKE